MTRFNRDRWKEIIGPEYDVIVKSFLSVVREIRQDTKANRLNLPDEWQTKLSIARGEIPFNSDTWIQELIRHNEIASELPYISELLRVFNNFGDRLKNEPKMLQADLIALAEKLPEDSKNFYVNWLTKVDKKIILPSKNMKKATRDKIIKSNTKRFNAIIGSLMCRYSFLEFDRFHEKTFSREILDKSGLLHIFNSLIYSLLSQIAFQTTISELLLKGDDESLLRAVRIDKYIVSTDIIKRRIAEAQSSGDRAFLKKLGKNISYEPLEKEAMYYEAYVVLRTFWNVGLSLLKPNDMDSFLTACGIIHPPQPETLKKFIERNIQTIYGK